MTNDKWNDLLRNALSDYEQAPPEGLWESLAETIPAYSPAPPARKHVIALLQPRRFYRRIIVAGIALLLSAGIGLLFLTDGDLSQSPANIKITNTAPAPHPLDEKPAIPADNDTHVCSRHITSIQHRPADNTPMGVSADSSEKLAPASDEVQNIPAESGDTVPVYRPSVSGSTHRYIAGAPSDGKRSAGQLSIGILTACASQSGGTVGSTFPGGNQSDCVIPPGTDCVTPPGSNSNGPVPDTPVKEEETTETHYGVPFRLGLTLQYSFNDRLAVETGLMYSRLSSEERVSRDDRVTLTKYRLNYIGIPLTLKYRIASPGAVDFYVSAGGAVEKCVKGDAFITVIADDAPDPTRESYTHEPLQWSLSAGVGLQYRPVKYLGIYIEPSMVYYPSNHSRVPSIYHAHPVNFSLTAGLRFILPR